MDGKFLNKNNIKFLVVHCSDTNDKHNLTSIDIHKMHVGFGWDGIGYHKIITKEGVVENGRPEFWIGAHVYGKNNCSLGVCLIGKDQFNDKQFSALEAVLKEWKKKYPSAEILGHRDAIKTKKTCPNFDVNSWCKEKLLF
ncbi:N-acetylmuramoyl-L-alanine amidase [Alphaproteobacteria bacterium]|nr:N-acetylmuramoyl-L-alanine amidase [Alphaproteobacteria bacterium]